MDTFWNNKRITAEDLWTRTLPVEKNCELKNVTPASKFLPVVGRSTGDYELKKKIRKSDRSVETITALINQRMYDRLNDSNYSKDGLIWIKHVQKRPCKPKWTEKSDKNRMRKDRKIENTN